MLDNERVTLQLGGLTCAACVKRVEDIFKKQEGVLTASVNLANQKVLITYKKGFYNLEKWAKEITEAGYELIGKDSADVRKESRKRRAEELQLHKNRFLLATIIGLLGFPFAMPQLSFWVNHMVSGGIAFVLATIVVLFPGRHFYILAYKGLLKKTFDMNTLVALGTGTAYIYSALVFFFPKWFISSTGEEAHYFYESFFMIMALILFGRFLEARAKGQASSAMERLLSIAPQVARLIGENGEIDVAIEEIKLGDKLLIRAGETFAVDGKILEGSSAIEEALLTGEPVPVDKTVNDVVYGGTKNLSGLIIYEAKSTGEDSALGRIVKMVEQAQGSKPPIQELVDKVSAVFVPIVLVIALSTFLIWFVGLNADLSLAITRMVGVLVVACPCAMGLATPTAIMVGTGVGADLGLLYKDAAALEKAAKLTYIALDKTGTITEGKPVLTDIKVFGHTSEAEALTWAAALERGSEHPLAKAVTNKASERGLNYAHELVEEFKALVGFGVFGKIQNKEFTLGKVEATETSEVKAVANSLAQEGKTLALLKSGEEVLAILAWSDTIKPESKSAIKKLKNLNIETIMLTGDSPLAAKFMADKININFQAGLKPEDKLNIIEKAKKEGHITGMVGDGLNDAPALAASDLGIAMGAGTEVALESAKLALLTNNLEKLPAAVSLGRRTVRIIKENLFWAFSYNIVFIPLAAGVFVPWGLVISPALCALAMALSSVLVITNSLRLKLFKE